jgi:hypothetical protein
MSNTDVSSKRLTSAGSLGVGPTRVRAVYLVPNGSDGLLTLANGVGGEVLMELATRAAGDGPQQVDIPGSGIRFTADVHVAMSNIASATIFYA